MKLSRIYYQWIILFVISTVLIYALQFFNLPAGVLIGAMVSGIIIGVGGGNIGFTPRVFGSAQSIVGCLMAASLSPEIFPVFMRNWPVFTIALASTVGVSSVLGLMIGRWQILPGTVGSWGLSPGGAAAMVLMAEAFGADQRLVAFMQYMRVIMVGAGAALIARMWADAGPADAAHAVSGPLITPSMTAIAIVIALVGSAAGRRVRLPSPFLLGPFVLGSVVRLGFDIEFHIPYWLATISFALIGWTIGLKFKRETLAKVFRSLPHIMLSILALMAFCGGISLFLALKIGIDPLTAYLATTPGGIDTVSIIAMTADNVDISFVMTMQALRFLFVLVVGPTLARLAASWARA